MVTYALATPAKERSLGGLLVAGAIGAVTGAATVGIGAKIAPLVGVAARAVAPRIAAVVARTAVQKMVASASSGAARDVAAEGLGRGPGAFLAGSLPDDALVVRGGLNTTERISGGSGVWTDATGNVQGVSVNSGAGRTVEELAQGIPNKQIGVTTVGAIRRAGGDIVGDATPRNPFHCLAGGLSAAAFSGLFSIQPNPCG
jgi:hypothetical protein